MGSRCLRRAYVRLLGSFLVVLATMFAPAVPRAAAHDHAPAVVRIGVTEAPRGREETLRQFTPTAEYLSRRFAPRRFELVVEDFEGLEDAVAAGEVDYTICNPSFYVLLETKYGVTRIATLLRRVDGGVEGRFGSVVFAREDSGLRTYEDLVGGTFMVRSPACFGGWQTAQREFIARGIDPERDLQLLFAERVVHDEVVEAVLSGAADAGCVPTGILEAMAAQGALDLGDITVIEPRAEPGFSDLLSTPLYPEWAFAEARGLDREFSEDVAAALYDIDEVEPEALVSDIGGWTVPLSYAPVHDLLRELELPPYDRMREFTIIDAVRRYWLESVAVLVVGVILALAVTVTGRLNRRLARANVDLADANAAKAAFLAKMSHELRTPLNSVIGFTGLLLRGMPGPINAEQRKQLEMVSDSGKHLLALVNDVLDLSRIETGALVFTPAEFPVAETLDSVRNAFAEAASAKGLELAVEDRTEGAVIESDGPRVRQILFNLVDNAIKYTDEGRVSVMADAEGDEIVYCVCDTGSGIPPGLSERIFDEFSQLTPSDGELNSGLGLGLAISRSLASLLGGALRLVPTAETTGCVFELRLPRRARRVRA